MNKRTSLSPFPPKIENYVDVLRDIRLQQVKIDTRKVN